MSANHNLLSFLYNYRSICATIVYHICSLNATSFVAFVERSCYTLFERSVRMENSFGKYLVHLREQKSISQRKLAELAGVTNSTISRLEADLVTPDLKTLEKLANALKIDKALLLTKCGYSEIPEEFVIIARKTGELSEEKRAEAYKIFNDTIDRFLLDDDDDEED